MKKKYIVRLTGEERQALTELISKGRTQAYKIRHAHILLRADADADGPAWSDTAIAEAFSCHIRTVEGLRKRFVLQGLCAALERKKRARPPVEKILDGAGEARLIALACACTSRRRTDSFQPSPCRSRPFGNIISRRCRIFCLSRRIPQSASLPVMKNDWLISVVKPRMMISATNAVRNRSEYAWKPLHPGYTDFGSNHAGGVPIFSKNSCTTCGASRSFFSSRSIPAQMNSPCFSGSIPANPLIRASASGSPMSVC